MEVKNCPVCGSPAILETSSMDEGNGRGYPGHSWYTCRCCNCSYIPKGKSEDVYRSKREAIDAAIESWNKEVDKFNKIKKEN